MKTSKIITSNGKIKICKKKSGGAKIKKQIKTSKYMYLRNLKVKYISLDKILIKIKKKNTFGIRTKKKYIFT